MQLSSCNGFYSSIRVSYLGRRCADVFAKLKYFTILCKSVKRKLGPTNRFNCFQNNKSAIMFEVFYLTSFSADCDVLDWLCTRHH